MISVIDNSFVEVSSIDLFKELSDFGVVVSESGKESLRSLMQTFFDGLSGVLDPNFYLNSLPPGSGKTQAISSFVRTWKEKGFYPSGGIIIGLKTKDEIEGLVRRLGISPEHFSCFTSDDRVNALGRADGDSAPVLLTTQQMIIRRTADRSFAAARDFHFSGKPRALRIWDESFSLAEQVSLTLFELQGLLYRLQHRFPDLAELVARFADEVRIAEPGTPIRVPTSFKGLGRAHSGGVVLPSWELDTIANLQNAAGRSLMVRTAGGSYNRALVGSTRPIPADFAPVIITDASVRVRATYGILEEAQGNVVRLPSSDIDYRNVRIHLWEQSCGKDVLKDTNKSWEIYRGIAKEMEQAEGPWLVISNKASGELDVEAALKDATGGRVPFHYLHWGRHHGTNDYTHIKNIVVIGSYFYRNEAYEGIGVAATGLPAEEVPELDTKEIRAGEFRHNMLQAILRGNARNSVDGVAGECSVYVVASPKSGARRLLAEVFPGAEISDWGQPKERALARHEDSVLAALKRLFTPGVDEVRKKQVYEVAGMDGGEFRRQMKRPSVQLYMRSAGLVSEGQQIKRRAKA